MDNALWVGHCRSRGTAVMGVGLGLVVVAAGGLIAFVASPVGGWLVVAVGVLLTLTLWWAARLAVHVGPSALTTTWGPWRWPRKRITWDKVREISAIQVEPRAWGGWGYRWNPRAHATAAVVRRGPGIKVDLENGQIFVVTVDDAINGAKASEHARSSASRAHHAGPA
jgi:hypothetical protein